MISYQLVHGDSGHVLGHNDGTECGIKVSDQCITTIEIGCSLDGNIPGHGVDLAWTLERQPTNLAKVHLRCFIPFWTSSISPFAFAA